MKNRLTLFKNIPIKRIGKYPLLMLLLIASCTSVISQNFTTKEVKFVSEGDLLSGTILIPNKIQAALVLVHGSGQEKRMLGWATNLAGNGIAVLTYDKRGVGESAGVYAGPEVGTNNVDFTNLNLLSLDASAAVNSLSETLANNRIAIGLMGASQAGWIIPLAAEKNKKVKFMAIFSGSLITAKEQLRFQFYTNGNEKFWDTHTEEEARKHVFHDPDRYEFTDTNPKDALSKLTIPGLWVFGGKDIQVPVKLSIEYLDSLKSKGKEYQYKLYPNLGHNTSFSDSGGPMDYVTDWVKKQQS